MTEQEEVKGSYSKSQWSEELAAAQAAIASLSVVREELNQQEGFWRIAALVAFGIILFAASLLAWSLLGLGPVLSTLAQTAIATIIAGMGCICVACLTRFWAVKSAHMELREAEAALQSEIKSAM